MIHPAPVGHRIRVTANNNCHHYRVGGIYRVHEVDDDGTFKAADEHGFVGDYIRWSDCELAGLGWDWLRDQLDSETLDLLAAFEGVEHLTLRPDIESTLIASIPNLKQAILEVLPDIEEQIDGTASPSDPFADDEHKDLDTLLNGN